MAAGDELPLAWARMAIPDISLVLTDLAMAQFVESLGNRQVLGCQRIAVDEQGHRLGGNRECVAFAIRPQRKGLGGLEKVALVIPAEIGQRPVGIIGVQRLEPSRREQRKTWLIAAAVVIVAVLAGAALALARFEARRRRKATEENVHLQSDLEEREKKIRRLVDANIIGIIIWDLEGRILDANDAFLGMVGYDREDLASGRLHWTSLTAPEWRDRDARTMAELELIGTVQPFEKEYSPEGRQPRARADRRDNVRRR